MFKNIDEFFREYMERNWFTCGSIYISRNGRKLYHQSYGILNNEKRDIKCRKNSLFDLASVTKIVTATVILKLLSEGSLHLSAPLGYYIPELSKNKALAPITLKQLLTHSSGLIAWYPLYTYPQSEKDTLFTIFEEIKLKHQQRKKVVYSDLNYILLGEVLKHYFKSDLETIVRTQLAEPLHLDSLTYFPPDQDNVAATEYGNRIEKKMCHELQLSFSKWRTEASPIEGEANDGNAYYFFGGQSGHAGLFSNVIDVAKIGELYVKGGLYNGKQFIHSRWIENALSLHAENRGLGWEKSDIYPNGYGHTGFTGTAIWIEPERKLSVALFTNRLHVKQPVHLNDFRRKIFAAVIREVEHYGEG